MLRTSTPNATKVARSQTRGANLLAYLYAFFSGNADATRAAFLYGSLAGGIIVVGGLIWESGKINRATAVVILGVCLESFCTWRLFVVDEGISNDQQAVIRSQNDKIIALESPRIIDLGKLKKELEGKPTGKAVVVYVKECVDCEWLADWIWVGLHEAGWELADGRPSSLPAVLEGSIPSSPAAVARGHPWGVSVVANTNEDGSAQSALMWAMTQQLGHAAGGIDKSLPDGLVRVVVAPRP
jgi:hypothetical protein